MPDETGFAAGELRDAVAAGRGRLTDLSLSSRARMPPPDLMIGAIHAGLLRDYFGQTVVLGASLYEVTDAEVAAEESSSSTARSSIAGSSTSSRSTARPASGRSRRAGPACGR
ncbi:hypothetical protein ACFQWF_25875 [Methylorubrum suomiense]